MVLQKILNFWYKYENLNLKIAVVLMGLQIVHLTWLTMDVVLTRAVGPQFLTFPDFLLPLLIFVDYIEIPALIAGITFYSLALFHKESSVKSALFIAFLAIQLLHIFWITDEFVVKTLFTSGFVALPAWLAWVAILIDYLELPVIADLARKLIKGGR